MQLFLAPAKINLCLHVLGRRVDGYHDLCMLMQKVSLYDEVWIGLRNDSLVQVQCDGVVLPVGNENIATQAARAVLQHDPSGRGVDIRIAKHIPVAAGLGGGSSDAAAVLLALNSLLGLGLRHDILAQEALKLGADVPFFLCQSPAWAEGVGERLTPVRDSLPECYYVLVNPGVSVSTAEVYANVQSYSAWCTAGKCPGTIEALSQILHNDLQQAALMLAPVVAVAMECLLECGASGVLMSGSGPTVFGLFMNNSSAHASARRLTQTHGWWTEVVTGVC
ncbi:MAG: 4-(cytidine 5'-diphospho)-2-C-methyl-D-erythritol kinase [Desulfuromonadaceae bacterium]|nr:4-(cytidine 5'-diphospho)-2-C-methyl-D-erythritol kinase [Desulfuromonas sp.]MDY0186039.1 4-(cytidine 5'-diphospho)-2-C-methyl-D-erythritol kinase [Desulfuromonadaceae bacterium]